MSDFRSVRGFQDAFSPPAPRRGKADRATLKQATGRGSGRGASAAAKAKLARVVTRAPEVMVKITGRTKDGGHLTSHLEYISRNGEIPLESRDGVFVAGRAGVHDLADGWAYDVEGNARFRANSNYSVNIILSMPPGTDAAGVKDAVRAFAADQFGARHDYVFAYHDDTKHPHVHLTVKPLGDHGERLNPRKADLEEWRQVFAQKLRQRGIAAEATPRRARGVTQKAERLPVRKLKERGVPSTVATAAKRDAVGLASGKDGRLREWETASIKRQHAIRQAYLKDAADLSLSPEAADRALGQALTRFVKSMPAPKSRRMALAEELRAEFTRQAGRGGEARDQGAPGAPGDDNGARKR